MEGEDFLRQVQAMFDAQERKRRVEEDAKPVLGFCVDVHSADLARIMREKIARLEETERRAPAHVAPGLMMGRKLLESALPHLIEGVTYRLSMAEVHCLMGWEPAEIEVALPAPRLDERWVPATIPSGPVNGPNGAYQDADELAHALRSCR